MKCPQCQSTEIVDDSSLGQTVCGDCGYVINQNSIVSEVGFVEGANGSSSVLGQFVPSTGASRLSASAKTRGPGGRGPSAGYQKETREHTIANGRKHIQQVADHLRLRAHHVDSAVRLFMLAVQHNFIQGRRTAHVVAACLYIVCRREKTPHLLIDFSDVLQINLYVLGATFLKFIRLLNLSLPIIDPSLYIHRFAAQLELKDEQNCDRTHLVAMTALRLVARMKRDWILHGRRPSGICGACLLISARIHGFKRTQKEIINVVKICDMTLRKRLLEFQNTQSSLLTLEEFEDPDKDVEWIKNAKELLEENQPGPNASEEEKKKYEMMKRLTFGQTQDPPAFTRNRLAEEKEQMEELQKLNAHRLVKKVENIKGALGLSDTEVKTLSGKQPELPRGSTPQLLMPPSPISQSRAPTVIDDSTREREMQLIQKESRQLIESNPAASDALADQIRESVENHSSAFGQIEEEQVSKTDNRFGTDEDGFPIDPRIHVTPLNLAFEDDPSGAGSAAASSSQSTAAASSADATAPPAPPTGLRERLTSVHKGPNLKHSRSRIAHTHQSATPSLLLHKDSKPNDLTSLFPSTPAVPMANNLAYFNDAGKPFADALAVISDPSLMETSSTGLTTTSADLVDPNLDNWTDFFEFDQEIEESIKLDEEDIKFKTEKWEMINQDYLKEQEEKKAIALAANAGNLGPDGQPLQRRSYKKKTKLAPGTSSSAAESAMRLLAEKNLSGKINYNALQSLLSNKIDEEDEEEDAAGDEDDRVKSKSTKSGHDDDHVEPDQEDEDMDDDEDDDDDQVVGKKRHASALNLDELPSSKQQRTIRSITARDPDDEDGGGVDEDEGGGDEDEEMMERRQSIGEEEEDVIAADADEDYD